MSIRNFKYKEFIKSATAEKNKINNECPAEYMDNIIKSMELMQDIRDKIAIPIYINCSYRNPQVNKLVGGVENSDHLKAKAIDFYTSETKKTYDAIMKDPKLMARIRYIHYYVDQNFIHVSLY